MEELQNNIVIYNPSEEINLEVRVAEETVWLNRQQIALLFGRDVKTIGKHILNAKQEELRDIPTVANFATVQYEGNRLVNRVVEYYNLDMIISIGYRVKSPKGVAFRQWANTILKNYIINGGIIYQKFVQLEARVCKTEAVIKEITQTAMPPKYGLFFNGQVFDAYVFVVDLIKSATNSIRLADNYVDESVLQMLSKRSEAVDATIFTERTTPQLQLDLRKHNAQYPPVHIKRIEKIHDRFLLIDDERLYHFGASFKDLGKKLFVVTLIEEPALIGAMGKMLS